MQDLRSEEQIVAAALLLGAKRVEGWSRAEEQLSKRIAALPDVLVRRLERQIQGGEDPLGEAFSRIRSPQLRRGYGATYTPPPVVEAMVSWAASSKLKPDRIVDPGTGSARFLLAAANAFPNARLLGAEIDPLAAVVARANLCASGLAGRAQVFVVDYRRLEIPPIQGRTLFIGNPPYVRHHGIDADAKRWLSEQACRLGAPVSQLAGLHAHFFLATVLKARESDFGIFITSAEWLDVNYGKLVRHLFLGGLGGQGITVLEPTERIFTDAATTSAISQFVVGSSPDRIRINRARSLAQPNALVGGRRLERTHFERESRWSLLTRRARKPKDGYVELGEFCSVHRGQVTGANRIWIAGDHSKMLPDSVLFPSITRAAELFEAGDSLTDASALRKVIDIPADFSNFNKRDRADIEQFLTLARSTGADSTYIARNRRAWWSVGLRSPAPILATYMARRAPRFVRNLVNVRHINIAHGLYPREPLDEKMLCALARYLSMEVSLQEGRVYAGGLAKFEPGEMERILVPRPELLEAMQAA